MSKSEPELFADEKGNIIVANKGCCGKQLLTMKNYSVGLFGERDTVKSSPSKLNPFKLQ